ncbi:MPK9, partial [Symbiodinium sp. KB8]
MAAAADTHPTWSIPSTFKSWEVDHTRFQFKRMLGKGSYGSVALARDHKLHVNVAIKKINNVFNIFENAKR